MNNMDRTILFEEYFAECKKEPKQFCGQGEKNSDILIIGKESTNVSVKINHGLCEAERGCGRIRDNIGIDTWNHYQSLINLVYCGNKPPTPEGKWDFEQYAFTTELNKKASPKTSTPNKETKACLADRLKLFRESPFIQTFPVVILACSNYIINQGEGEERQIDTTFGVEYVSHKVFSKFNKYYIHKGEYKYHGETIKKLVIHTRNLSQNVKRELLPSIAGEIRNHLGIN